MDRQQTGAAGRVVPVTRARAARTPQWLRAAWVGLLSLCLLATGAAAGRADHPHPNDGDQLHLNFMHLNSAGYGSYDETYCYLSWDPNTSDATVRGYVERAVTRGTLPRWDGLHRADGTADWRVDMYVTQRACDQYTPQQRLTIEIEFWAFRTPRQDPRNLQAPCGGADGISCADFDYEYPRWRQGGHTPHQDYQFVYIHLDLDELERSGDALVNHELGHAFGLADRGSYGDYRCPGSIMHNGFYGCSYPSSAPSNLDINSARAVANR